MTVLLKIDGTLAMFDADQAGAEQALIELASQHARQGQSLEYVWVMLLMKGDDDGPQEWDLETGPFHWRILFSCAPEPHVWAEETMASLEMAKPHAATDPEDLIRAVAWATSPAGKRQRWIPPLAYGDGQEGTSRAGCGLDVGDVTTDA